MDLRKLISVYKKSGKIFPKSAWVEHPDFNLYARVGMVSIDEEIRECITIANIQAYNPGNGGFERLIKNIQKEYPKYGIYVENVFNERFDAKLLRMGFTQVNIKNGFNCYFLGNIK